MTTSLTHSLQLFWLSPANHLPPSSQKWKVYNLNFKLVSQLLWATCIYFLKTIGKLESNILLIGSVLKKYPCTQWKYFTPLEAFKQKQQCRYFIHWIRYTANSGAVWLPTANALVCFSCPMPAYFALGLAELLKGFTCQGSCIALEL